MLRVNLIYIYTFLDFINFDIAICKVKVLNFAFLNYELIKHFCLSSMRNVAKTWNQFTK